MKKIIILILSILILSGCKFEENSSSRQSYDVNCTVKEYISINIVNGKYIGYNTSKEKEPYNTTVFTRTGNQILGESGYYEQKYINYDWDDNHQWIKFITVINPTTGTGRVDMYTHSINNYNIPSRILSTSILENCVIF